MSTCTDVYVRPQTCDQVWIYPSQVHPGGGGGGRPHGPVVSRGRHRIQPEQLPWKDDELAVILLMEAFTTD